MDIYLQKTGRENVDKKTRVGDFVRTDILTQNDAKIYYDIAHDADYKNRTPDAMFIGIHKLFSDDYLSSLSAGEEIDIASATYLNGIQPEWSGLDFIKDEDIKLFYTEQFNLGEFLDKFIKKMGIDVQ